MDQTGSESDSVLAVLDPKFLLKQESYIIVCYGCVQQHHHVIMSGDAASRL